VQTVVILVFIIATLIVIHGCLNEWKRIKVEAAQKFDSEENDLRNLQAWVGDWSDRVLKPKGASPQGTYKHLKDEMEELGRELDLYFYSDFSENHKQLKEKISKEIADGMIVYCHLAHQLDIDIAPHFIEKMNINEARKWSLPNAEGIIHHVDEGVLNED
jgi:NTP pyrophosphatase (non-canonical NTP hydrolase)